MTELVTPREEEPIHRAANTSELIGRVEAVMLPSLDPDLVLGRHRQVGWRAYEACLAWNPTGE